MGGALSTVDLAIFLVALVVVMAIGLIAGRKEETSQDYFLAGRSIRWWGVAGSIFGSNVSANHLVGMLGIGFSVGFAQSHFELGAIVGLMLLCYGFLPVYRKLQIYTLSDYLGQRYDERSRLLYAVIMVVIMVFVQMVPGFYIGSRAMGQLLDGTLIDPGYELGIVVLAVVAAVYTILGGLKAVVWTDVMQSMLLLGAGILVAVLTFGEIGGWSAMVQADAQQVIGQQKMHLYLPTNHPELPWSGVFTGLMILHFFYWGTNQFIVQRALAAVDDRDARRGIVAAGFFKLLIPFFAIGTGVAAAQLFGARLPGVTIDPDAAFPELVKLVVPAGWGIVGLIAAGLIGAILSSVDSMMNSAATIFTIDVYQRYVNPGATDRQLIRVGRLSIVVFVTAAALAAMFVLDPDSDSNFFLTIADYQGHLIPGLFVVFLLGMFWRRATATGAIVTIVATVAFSVAFEQLYNAQLSELAGMTERFGEKLNFLHRTAVAFAFGVGLHTLVSLLTRPDAEKSRLVWTEVGGHDARDLRDVLIALVSIGLFALGLGALVAAEQIQSWQGGVVAGAATLGAFVRAARRRRDKTNANEAEPVASLWTDDLSWAGLLCGLAMFMLFLYP